MKGKKETVVVADWKDTEELINGFKKAIKKLGGNVYDLPDFKGTDTYGFLVSDKKQTKKEINAKYKIPDVTETSYKVL